MYRSKQFHSLFKLVFLPKRGVSFRSIHLKRGLCFLPISNFTSSQRKFNLQNIHITLDQNSELANNLRNVKEKLDTANEAFSKLEYEQAADLYKQILSDSIENIAAPIDFKIDIMLKISQSLLFLNQPEESADYLIEALKANLKTHGKDHIKTAQIIALIGNLNFMCNRLEQSFLNFKECMNIYRNIETPTFQEQASVLRLMGNVSERQHYFEKAINFYQQAIESFEKDEGKNLIETYELRKNIAKISIKILDYTQAYDQYQQCLSFAEKYFERDPVELSDLEERCGELCLLLKRNSEASQHFHKAGQLLAEKFGDGEMKVIELQLKSANAKEGSS